MGKRNLKHAKKQSIVATAPRSRAANSIAPVNNIIELPEASKEQLVAALAECYNISDELNDGIVAIMPTIIRGILQSKVIFPGLSLSPAGANLDLYYHWTNTNLKTLTLASHWPSLSTGLIFGLYIDRLLLAMLKESKFIKRFVIPKKSLPEMQTANLKTLVSDLETQIKGHNQFFNRTVLHLSVLLPFAFYIFFFLFLGRPYDIMSGVTLELTTSSLVTLSEIPNFITIIQQNSRRKYDISALLNSLLENIKSHGAPLIFERIRNQNHTIIYALTCDKYIEFVNDINIYHIPAVRFIAIFSNAIKNAASIDLVYETNNFLAIAAGKVPTQQDLILIQKKLHRNLLTYAQKQTIQTQLNNITDYQSLFIEQNDDGMFNFLFVVNKDNERLIDAFTKCFDNVSLIDNGINVALAQPYPAKELKDLNTRFMSQLIGTTELKPAKPIAQIQPENTTPKQETPTSSWIQPRNWLSSSLSFWSKPKNRNTSKTVTLLDRDKSFDLHDKECPLKILEDSQNQKAKRYLLFGLKKASMPKEIAEDFWRKVQAIDFIIHYVDHNKQGICPADDYFEYHKRKSKTASHKQHHVATYKVKFLGKYGDYSVPIRFYDHVEEDGKRIRVFKLDNYVQNNAHKAYTK